jgi:hypothetical protein
MKKLFAVSSSHIGVHTQNSTDWGIDFLNIDYFKDHLERLRKAEKDYLVE